jgi:hypothetical protein
MPDGQWPLPAMSRQRPPPFSDMHLISLSQIAAVFAEKNHIFEKTQFSASERAEDRFAKNRGTWRCDFRHLLMV